MLCDGRGRCREVSAAFLPAMSAVLFDHSIGSRYQCRLEFNAEGLRGAQKDEPSAIPDFLLGFARRNARAFNKLCDAYHVRREQARMRLGRQFVVGEWQGSEFFQLRPQAWIGQSRAKRRVERNDGFARRALRDIEPMPHRIADLGHAEFGRRRHVL